MSINRNKFQKKRYELWFHNIYILHAFFFLFRTVEDCLRVVVKLKGSPVRAKPKSSLKYAINKNVILEKHLR